MDGGADPKMAMGSLVPICLFSRSYGSQRRTNAREQIMPKSKEHGYIWRRTFSAEPEHPDSTASSAQVLIIQSRLTFACRGGFCKFDCNTT